LLVIADPQVGDYLRIILVKPGASSDFTIHRPIGKTDLASDDWVLSDPTELAQLVQRKEDPAHERRQADLNSAVHAACLSSAVVVANADGAFEYAVTSNGTRSEFLGILKDAKKQAGSSWNRSHWLNASRDARAGYELALDRTKAAVTATWELNNPDNYRTRSGARMSTDQESLGWAKAKTLTQIEDTLREAIINGPDPASQITGYATTVPGSTPGTASGATNRTTIEGPDLTTLVTKDRKSVKYHLDKIHEILQEPRGTYVLTKAPPAVP
jgi:hypothetical protein